MKGQKNIEANNELNEMIETYLTSEHSAINQLRQQQNTIMVYCDASLNRSKHSIGVGVSIVGQGSVIFRSNAERIETTAIDSTYAELVSIVYALSILNELFEENVFNLKKIKRIFIYSDYIEIRRLLSKTLITKESYSIKAEEIITEIEHLREKYSKINYSVRYLGHAKKCFYYKKADQIAKRAVLNLVHNETTIENEEVLPFESNVTEELYKLKKEIDLAASNINQIMLKLEQIIASSAVEGRSNVGVSEPK
ncbi:hypothetical protein [Paenibacillus sp. MMO-58]|uniref:hypothetical protein n=1 Tax=Paenibacillus sp. MMO-58 TaxID=3081290 RepID=UPI003017EAAA